MTGRSGQPTADTALPGTWVLVLGTPPSVGAQSTDDAPLINGIKPHKKNEAMNHSREMTTWVALVGASLQQPYQSSHTDKKSSISVVSLPDPSSGEDRDYLLKGEELYEIQVIAAGASDSSSGCGDGSTDDVKYASFLVGSRVVSNGELHVVTSVDPLFWILYYYPPEEVNNNNNNNTNNNNHGNNTKQWQPLHQMMEQDIPNEMLRSIVLHGEGIKGQLGHVYDTTQLEVGDDGTFYKFSVTRSLQWLQRKQERVYQVLLTQSQQEEQQVQHRDGTFAATFQCGDEDDDEGETNKDESFVEAHAEAAKEDSIQVICNYLTPAWQTLFLQHLSCADDILLSPKQRQQRQERKRKLSSTNNNDDIKVVPDDSITTVGTTLITTSNNIMDQYMAPQNVVTPKSIHGKPTPRSMGNKQLAKVNTKGMKSMGSFFQAKKK